MSPHIVCDVLVNACLLLREKAREVIKAVLGTYFLNFEFWIVSVLCSCVMFLIIILTHFLSVVCISFIIFRVSTRKATVQTVVLTIRVIEPIDVLIIEAIAWIERWITGAIGHNVDTINARITQENAANVKRG